ncbi:MAG: CCA tRNA nucleotidyltransferase [Planctomycetota bacterium]
MTRRPSMQDLSAPLASAARHIARRISASGKRAWLVGGAPRDLALGRGPSEIDMTSAATPKEMEGLFDRTIPVGRAFGTIVVRVEGLDVQVTTFRSESGYTDARHPDQVAYGATVEGDSARRDFTCNALYLDPLDDAFADPQGGLADLAARRLRCVGEPEERFREDGLRLLRLARFAAALDLEPDPATLAAARRSSEALRGVSPERVREELAAVFSKPGCGRALAILVDLELLERAIPDLGVLASKEGGARAYWEVRARTFDHLPPAPGLALGLAALVDAEAVQALRPSRELLREVAGIQEAARAARTIDRAARSDRIRWMRSSAFEPGVALERARRMAEASSVAALDEALAERRRLGTDGLRPAPLLGAEDLVREGLAPGPAFGRLLHEAETRQLDGVDRTRADALAWLAQAAQEGGKTPRSAKDTG